MKLSSLLNQRRTLLQQARLANLAFAYDRLGDFARRIDFARLTGEVRLQTASPEAQRYLPTLTALEGSQAVIEEHFDEEDLIDFADVVAYALNENQLDLTFRLEQLEEKFLAMLRVELTQAGVVIDRDRAPKNHENSMDRSQADDGS